MTAVAPSRWRLIELRRSRDVVRTGIDLLDRKREALTRELVQRVDDARRRRTALQTALTTARAQLARAVVEVGRPASEAAAFAQAPPGSLEVRHDVVLGVHLPRVIARLQPLRLSYGPAQTTASLDEAARAFEKVLPIVLDVAAEETAVHNLKSALQRTTRTLNALEKVLMPRLESEIAAVSAGLEEEERDERVRRLRAMRKAALPGIAGTTDSEPGA